jgi:hypothetical protein
MKKLISAGCFTLAGIMAIAAFQTASSTRPTQESLTNTVHSIQQMALDKKQGYVVIDPGTTHKNPMAIFYGLLSAGFGVGGSVIGSLKDEEDTSEDLPMLASADGAIGLVGVSERASESDESEREVGNSLDPASFELDNKVADSKIPSTRSHRSSSHNWVDRLTNYPCLLIYGAQGSGKTTLASEIVHRRLKSGHRVIVLDPHKKAGDWKGLECYGAGLNYGEINEQLRWFDKEVESRYKLFSEDENYAPSDVTLICDEFTNWASRCEGADNFFAAAMSDIRKIKVHVIFLSHGRTLATLGNAKGLAGTRDAGLMEVELLAEPDPITGEPRPTFEGWLKMPGKDQKERQAIAIEKITPNFDFSSYQRDNLEKLYNLPDAQETLVPVPNDLPEPLFTIMEFAKSQGNWISARDVQRKNYPILKNFTSDDIRGCFLDLAADYRKGEVEGQDANLKYRYT